MRIWATQSSFAKSGIFVSPRSEKSARQRGSLDGHEVLPPRSLHENQRRALGLVDDSAIFSSASAVVKSTKSTPMSHMANRHGRLAQPGWPKDGSNTATRR